MPESSKYKDAINWRLNDFAYHFPQQKVFDSIKPVNNIHKYTNLTNIRMLTHDKLIIAIYVDTTH